MVVSVTTLPTRFGPGGRRALDGGPRPRLRPAWLGRDKLSVIAIAALTSASVSQLTLWIGGERASREREVPLAAELSAPLSAVVHTPAEWSRSLEPLAPEPPPRQSPADLSAAFAVVRQSPEFTAPAVVNARSVSADAVPVATSGSAPVRQTPMVSRAAPRTGSAATGTVRATAPTPGPAALIVITEPAGARVTINGLGWGSTPLTIPNPPPGSKRIRVSKPGYRSQERVLGEAGAGAGTTLHIELAQDAAAGGTR
jgi:hypothetical protein